MPSRLKSCKVSQDFRRVLHLERITFREDKFSQILAKLAKICHRENFKGQFATITTGEKFCKRLLFSFFVTIEYQVYESN